MKMVCISDTHLRHWFDIPEGDVLVHAGDFLLNGTISELNTAMDWFGSLPHPHKIMIAGNHDRIFESDYNLAKSLVPPGVIYLQDQETTIEGFKFYGAPWSPAFCNWAFGPERGEDMAEKWQHIPRGTDVLITHGPQFKTLDKTDGTYHPPMNVGCEELRKAIRKINPRYHIFGHIHGQHGVIKHKHTTHINASICDESYRPFNKPIVVTLD